MKESINQEYIVILNMYAPDNKAAKYVKQKLIALQKKKKKTNPQTPTHDKSP